MSKELEALNGLFDLIHCQDSFEKAQEYFDIIEEALEHLESINDSKPYLKWEDLEFEENKEFFVLLNGTKYKLNCYKDYSENIYVMIILNDTVVADLCSIFKADKQFFNDLHLEVIKDE